MATAGLREELNCSICLDIYTDPVNLRCGHNYCRDCIDQALDEQRASGANYTCPECRTIYRQRPELQRNITLCNIAERFLSAHQDLEEDGVICTYCIHSPVPAVKACLMCEACLCENHLRVHSKSEEHVLMEPGISLAKKCPIHNRNLEYYCAHDQVCICAMCKQDGKHRGHQVETINSAANKKKEKLKDLFRELTYLRQQTDKNVQSLQKDRQYAEDQAGDVIERVTNVFSEIMDKLQDMETNILNGIKKRLEQNTKPISNIIQQLETQSDELSSRMCHIEELCDVSDPLTVLQEEETNSRDFYLTEKHSCKTWPIYQVDEVLISLQMNKDLAAIVADVKSQFYVPENADIELDPETASHNVVVSSDWRTAIGVRENEDHFSSYDTFESHQVLSLTDFRSGIHYWEVEVSGSANWRIGMCYGTMNRCGGGSVLGNRNDSWCICKTQQGYSFRHNGRQTYYVGQHVFRQSKRLGIFLDYEDGRLSFYHLGNQITHLHTFDAYFREALQCAIRVGLDVKVEIIS